MALSLPLRRKEIKNAPSALLSYISTRNFLRTREKCGEAPAEDECFSHFFAASGNSSTMHEELSFFFFYNELGLTNPSAFLNVRYVLIDLLSLAAPAVVADITT